MSKTGFHSLVVASGRRLAMPIAVYPGLALTGGTVRAIVSNPNAQFDAVAALHARYRAPVMLSAMDLSAEAEAFGCAVQMADHEIPFVMGRLITNRAEAERLAIPQPGDRRTAVHLEVVRQLSRQAGERCVVGGCIGPFSLASRLVGVSEALELTLAEPGLMHRVLQKTTQFLIAYVRAFRVAGASGVVMAEPTAGLLSPRGLTEFASAYLNQIREAAEDENFTIVLHNCAAKLVHLPALLESGLRAFHFAAPMDIVPALGKIPPRVVLCGNLDPTAVFVQAKPVEIAAAVGTLLVATQQHQNFVLSSGCDLPPSTPLENLDAFFAAAA